MISGGSGKAISASLDEIARMERAERVRAERYLRRHYPLYRALSTRVALARALGFAAGLALAVSVVLLAQGAGLLWVAGLVLLGLLLFGYVVVRLTDSRFDLLLAALGAHRAEEGRTFPDERGSGADAEGQARFETSGVFRQ
ncbi:hypothetical protein [Actinopolyspora saharensis]|uniref:Uncharacterized protein n=1 Tax=Actinopolyspora saharensis TaxID=995062 RepID=A0A1H1D0U7_9ACTN|nr:hypothetical protein [Actinopolyspora saharensis]SDQ70125.1 hypothetical protein SAMN04489718_1842 [Actinopolyspora saharensis]